VLGKTFSTGVGVKSNARVPPPVCGRAGMLLDIPGVRVVSDSIWISPSIHLRRKLTVLGPTLGGGTTYHLCWARTPRWSSTVASRIMV
jgi:hypothetical protein